MIKGLLSVAACLFSLASNVFAATSETRDDLWDLSRGTTVTATSGTLDGSSPLGMLGGPGFTPELGTTIFSGSAGCFVQWRTAAPVTVGQIRLFASGDNQTSTFRTFSKFTLKTKSAGSSTFDQTVFVWNPVVPYQFIDWSTWFILETNLPPFTAQEFRAEFQAVNGGPRVIELDAFAPSSPIPAIVQDPVPQTVWAGSVANFSVTATGETPLTYLWKHEGTNLVLSSHIQSPDGKTLQITNVVPEDAGSYSVLVTNNSGQVESKSALLTVNVDTNAPVVQITSPSPGTIAASSVVLEGTISDDQSVSKLRWERNGTAGGILPLLPLSSGSFSTSVNLLPGENRFKVIATDPAGNEGSAEVTVSISPTMSSNEDLWDVSRGTVVTASTPVFPESEPGLLGGSGFFSEPGRTVFADGQTNGFVHYVEWKTVAPVNVSTIRVYAGGDGPTYNNGREFGRFTLKTKSPGSSTFDVTVLTYVPQHPYVYVDPAVFLLIDTNVPAFFAQEFRGEFEQINLRAEGYNAPRVVELDAFGPAPSGPPQIVSQPSSKTVFTGTSASLVVGVTGGAPLTYQWRREGTNLTESAHFNGVNSWNLTINNLTPEDAGDYSVVVANSEGEVTSNNAHLTVEVDTNAPIVTIASPGAGTRDSAAFTLSGTIDEANALASVQWELNSRAMGSLTVANGQFNLPGQTLDPGENHIRVIASDASGNTGSAEVVVSWIIPRSLLLDAAPTQQEGGRVSIPISLVSTGGVAGATFVVGFNTNFLTDVQFQWSDAVASGFTSANLDSPNKMRFSFALPGTSLPSGKVLLGTINFRTRSVFLDTATPLTLTLQDIASETGDTYSTGNTTRGTTVKITRRKFIGDNNANDRLDVGDATIILRLISRLDIPRQWDTPANDLNRSFTLDSGDAIRVLRAVVGLDPQPTLTAPDAGDSAKKLQVAATTTTTPPADPPDPVTIYPVDLIADKTTAEPGQKVTLWVVIGAQTKSISGASFRLKYPADALRLESAAAHQVGSLVPAGSVALWNVSPNQNNYATQDGTISLAVSSATAWPSKNGALAKFVFTVQPGATSRYGWPVQLENVELSRDGFTTDLLGGDNWTFIGRAAADATFTPAITFNANGAPKLTLHGDLGATYRVEASNDLLTWSPVGTYYSADGSITIDDAAANGATARFYKATLVQ